MILIFYRLVFLLFLHDKKNCQDFLLTIRNMKHYSCTQLRAYLKYVNGLTVLDLGAKGLLKVPDAVTELSEIEKLELDRNMLIELPTSISKLKNLTVLTLNDQCSDLTELPAEIGDLRELRELWVSHNKLVGLPPL